MRLLPAASFAILPSGQGTAYLNGGAYSFPMTTSSISLVLSGNARIRIGNGDGSTYHTPVCRYAIYSRALTAAEIAANYAVDKARFNLP